MMQTLSHQEVYICYLDVLGFKELIENNEHYILDQIFDSKIIGFVNLLLDDEINRNSEEQINFLSVSDSIILWSNNTSDKSLFRLINHTKSIMISSVQKGVPLRGAISYGPLSVKKQNNQTIIIGKALTKAYSLENKQEWSGCVLDEGCIRSAQRLEHLKNNHFICNYQVPYKSGPIRQDVVIDWVSNNKEEWEVYTGISEQLIKNSFARHNKNTEDWSVKKKIDNTIAFYRDVIRRNNAGNVEGARYFT